MEEKLLGVMEEKWTLLPNRGTVISLLFSLSLWNCAGTVHSPMHSPYLSVVMGGRNDDWGGNFTQRLEASLRALFDSAAAHNLHCEAVVVDYNPPSDKTPFSSLPWPTPVPPSTLHIVTVPRELHERVAALPKWTGYTASLFEYVAKNVGIRASSGEFVLVTNPDIILSWNLLHFISQRSLSHTAFYTISRSDLFHEPPAHLRGRELDSWCNDAARHGQGLAPGDFLIASAQVWYALGGFPESGSNAGIDSWTLSGLRSSVLEEIHIEPPLWIFHQKHEAGSGSRGRAMRETREVVSGSNAHAEAALLSRAMRVMRRRMIWGESAESMSAWGLGGTFEAAQRSALHVDQVGSPLPNFSERLYASCNASMLKEAHTGVCLDSKQHARCPLHSADTVRQRANSLCGSALQRFVSSSGGERGVCEEGAGECAACAEASCCTAMHMLVGDAETAKHIAQLVLPNVLLWCGSARAAALAAAVGAVEHLSMFPQEAMRSLTLGTRLHPARWAAQARRAHCFLKVFGPLLASEGQKVDPREAYNVMEARMVEQCGGELEVPLEELCNDDVLYAA